MSSKITIDDREDALIVIDLQPDFMPGGALAVAGGDAVVPIVNALVARFAQVVVTQDWHPPGHASFASTHEGAKPFDTKRLPYGDQTLWPEHCVQGTPGAGLHPDLAVDSAFLVIRKGMNQGVNLIPPSWKRTERRRRDCAAPQGARREEDLRLRPRDGLLRRLLALDAAAAGFETLVIDDACRAIDAQGSLAAAWARMDLAGVQRISSTDILG